MGARVLIGGRHCPKLPCLVGPAVWLCRCATPLVCGRHGRRAAGASGCHRPGTQGRAGPAGSEAALIRVGLTRCVFQFRVEQRTVWPPFARLGLRCCCLARPRNGRVGRSSCRFDAGLGAAVIRQVSGPGKDEEMAGRSVGSNWPAVKGSSCPQRVAEFHRVFGEEKRRHKIASRCVHRGRGHRLSPVQGGLTLRPNRSRLVRSARHLAAPPTVRDLPPKLSAYGVDSTSLAKSRSTGDSPELGGGARAKSSRVRAMGHPAAYSRMGRRRVALAVRRFSPQLQIFWPGPTAPDQGLGAPPHGPR